MPKRFKLPGDPVNNLNDFLAGVQQSEGCWVWNRAKGAGGYGTMTRKGVVYRAHRLSWELHNGPIPNGHFVCHKCDNPPCVRPDHLFTGTAKDNSLDMRSKDRGAGKLSREDAMRIKELLFSMPPKHICERFGITNATLSGIRTGRIWSWLKISPGFSMWAEFDTSWATMVCQPCSPCHRSGEPWPALGSFVHSEPSDSEWMRELTHEMTARYRKLAIRPPWIIPRTYPVGSEP